MGERAEVLEAVVRVTTDNGGRVARREDIIRHWEPLAGAHNAGPLLRLVPICLC